MRTSLMKTLAHGALATALAAGFAAAGLYVGFFVAPTDATQGESYRIIFLHVPAAWHVRLTLPESV